MNIWIDITNSPHVLFFRPIIKRMRDDGHSVIVTAREYAQTISLLEKFNIQHHLIGSHKGKSKILKAFGFIDRVFALVSFMKSRSIDIAIGHASNDLAVAAKILSIPQITAFDYEYAKLSHSVNLRLVNKCLVPIWIPDEVLMRYGIARENILKYNGLKEKVYLWDFIPEETILQNLGINDNKTLVVFRPPATMAAYHPKSANLTWEIAEFLAEKIDTVTVVCLPRTADQKREFLNKCYSNFIFPEHVVDGPSLIYYSDLVVCGGGTMNREAAALSTPVWAIFEGEIGAVDKYLSAENLVKIVTDIRDVKDWKSEKKIRKIKTITTEVFDEVYDKLINFQKF